MAMLDSKEYFENALKNFPSWSDIRKRPETSNGGKILKAIAEEQDNVKKAYDEFIKSFFLANYAGKENETLSRIALSNVGSVSDITLQNIDLEVTTNPRTFIEDTATYALLQNGMILMDPAQVTNIDTLIYQTDSNAYTAPIVIQDLWNIFDEFAAFSSLSRYNGESNKNLANRIYAAHKKPTNGSYQGLKNAIINCMMNDVKLYNDDIIIEQPDENNMFELDKDGVTSYDKLSLLNHDIARTKQWNNNNWENTFKKTYYINNKWDEELECTQNGTGQRDDLLVKMSGDNEDSTNITINAYTKSTTHINEYVRKQGITKTIPIELKSYKDEINAKTLEYKIVATPVKRIDPTTIFIKSSQKTTGEANYYIEDIIIDKTGLTEINHGALKKDVEYMFKFISRDEYSDMSIYKANFTDNDKNVINLLAANPFYDYVGGVFKNLNEKLHLTKLSQTASFTNMVLSEDGGLTIGTEGTSGTLAVDVSSMSKMKVIPSISCKETNYTDDTNAVTLSEDFQLVDTHTITSNSDKSGGYISVKMNCTSISFELAEQDEAAEQGSVTVQLMVNGKLDVLNSGLLSEPKVYKYNFNNLKTVVLVITKTGSNPVTIRNICAAKYKITYWLDKGGFEDISDTCMTLPANIAKGNLLHVDFDSYSTYSPVLNYLHIGKGENTPYSIQYKPKTDGQLEINTDCQVQLYERNSDGEWYCTDADFTTRTFYRNDSTQSIYVPIDTSNFAIITASSKTISKIAVKGASTSCIMLEPKETIEKISITGENYVTKERRPVSEYICNSTLDKVYVTSNSPGFIIMRENGVVEIKNIERVNISTETDYYEFENLPEDCKGVFSISGELNTKFIDNSYNKDFESCYIVLNNSTEYIAYNSVEMLQPILDDISLSNTFTPYLDDNILVFYQISEELNTPGKVSFVQDGTTGRVNTSWALGKNFHYLHAEYTFDYSNTDDYQIDVSNINESFTLSNNIELARKYIINDVEYELGRYILKVPDNMVISYSTETVMEKLIVLEDGFNKLYYSNVKEIDYIKIGGREISKDDYFLLKTPGIVVWNNLSEYVGDEFEIVYDYKRPRSISFKDLNYLYDLVGYSIDAYDKMTANPIVISELKDGDSYTVEVKGKIPDKLIVYCDNSNFKAIVNDNKILVKKVSDANTVMVHSGYFYDNNVEYYLFENDYKDASDRIDNIELTRTKRVGGTIRNIQHSYNYLLDSIMTNGDHYEKICDIDFTIDNTKIKGLSDFNYLTACDSYQLWNDFNMTVELVDGYIGKAIRFIPENSNAYAIMDITGMIQNDALLSFIVSGELRAFIMKEILIEDNHLMKSTYVELVDEIESEDNFYQYHFGELGDYKYYLYVTGAGTIDDIVSCPWKKDYNAEDLHKKNISLLSFDIQERATSDYEVFLDFDTVGNYFFNTEMDKDNVIETGSSVDWGLTLINSFKEEFDDCVVENVDYRKNAFYTSDETGTVTTPWVSVKNYKAADTIYAKINDIMDGNMRFFNIHVLTADDSDGTNSKELAYTKKTNEIKVLAKTLSQYIQIIVEMPAHRVINNIETYAKYVEGINDLHVSQYNSGYMLTKIYNTASVGNYRVKKFIGSAENIDSIAISVRGYRQDDEHGVWTNWYSCKLNENLEVSNAHEFKNYQYFQFKISLNNMESTIKIEKIILEAT